jgi:RNA polymerase sigma-70 factor (ECF subfamily)
MESMLDEWFVAEVLVHEAALTRFLSRRWHESADIPDLRQETYIRVYEAARSSRPQHPRAFLFTTARNLMADRIRRSRIVPIEAIADLEQLNVLSEEATPEQHETSRQEVQRLAQALERLPPRCRDVIWLRRVKGLSQKEVAATLGIAEGTVEKQVSKAVRLLADMLCGRSSAREETAAARNDGISRQL